MCQKQLRNVSARNSWGQRVRWTDFSDMKYEGAGCFMSPGKVIHDSLRTTMMDGKATIHGRKTRILAVGSGVMDLNGMSLQLIGPLGDFFHAIYRDASTNQHSGIVVTIVVYAGSQTPPSPSRSTCWSTREGAGDIEFAIGAIRTPPIPISRQFSQLIFTPPCVDDNSGKTYGDANGRIFSVCWSRPIQFFSVMTLCPIQTKRIVSLNLNPFQLNQI